MAWVNRFWCVLALMLAIAVVCAPCSARERAADDAADGAKVRLMLTDSVGQAQAVEFEAYDEEGWPAFVDRTDDRAVMLPPGRWRLVPIGLRGPSIEVEIRNQRPQEVPLTVPDSLWITVCKAEQAPKQGEPPPPPPPPTDSRRVLLTLKSADDRIGALRFAAQADDGRVRQVLALRRPGATDEQIAEALALARAFVRDAPTTHPKEYDHKAWTLAFNGALAAHRVLSTLGDASDVRMLSERVNAHSYPPHWDLSIAAMAAIEVRLGLAAGGLTESLLAHKGMGTMAGLALAGMGYASADDALRASLRDAQQQNIMAAHALGGRMSDADLAAVRAWVKDRHARFPYMFTVNQSNTAAAQAVLCLLAQGTLDDWRFIGGMRLGLGTLERLGIVARDVAPLAAAAAELGSTWPTYDLAAAQRSLGDAAARAAHDDVALAVGGVFGRANEKSGDAADQVEYYWVNLVATAWMPNGPALEAFQKGWIRPEERIDITRYCPWLTHDDGRAKAAGMLALGDFGWADVADYAAPAAFAAAGIAPEDRTVHWPLLRAAHAVCTRTYMPAKDIMPMGIERRPFALRASEGNILGVLECRPAWRDDTLRLSMRFTLRANYVVGGLIDFHQGDITSYDHYPHATFPWMKFVERMALSRGAAEVPLRRTGLDDEQWMTFEASTPGRDLADLWLHVTLAYGEQRLTLTFDLARSDWARLLRRAEFELGDSPGAAPSNAPVRDVLVHATRLLSVGRCADAWMLLKRTRGHQAALLAASHFGALGDHARAADALTLLTERSPLDADAWYDLAVAQYLARTYEAALASINMVMALDPSNALAPRLKARLLVLLGRLDDARTILSTAPLASLNDAEARMLRFFCTLRAGDAGTAAGKARAKAEQDAMRAYAESFDKNSPERRFWTDAHDAWGGGSGERDARAPGALCVYLCYRGYGFAAAGRNAHAIPALKRALETGCADMAEYRLAEALLGRLTKEPP